MSTHDIAIMLISQMCSFPVGVGEESLVNRGATPLQDKKHWQQSMKFVAKNVETSALAKTATEAGSMRKPAGWSQRVASFLTHPSDCPSKALSRFNKPGHGHKHDQNQPVTNKVDLGTLTAKREGSQPANTQQPLKVGVDLHPLTDAPPGQPRFSDFFDTFFTFFFILIDLARHDSSWLVVEGLA